MLTLLSDAGRPVLCLVDDVQWLDGPSAGVLAFVVRRVREEPVVVLAAARTAPDRVPPGHWSRTDLVDRFVQAGLPERVIGRLAPGEASALLAERCGGPLAAPVRDALLAAAAGNPRTVDHHLRSIYRKFGITSRAELALLAGELAVS